MRTLPSGFWISLWIVGCFLYCQVKCEEKEISARLFQDLRTDQIIRLYGYPGEEHKVKTEDGYILTNYRIANPGGYPILLLHGMNANGDCWLLRGPDHDMAFLLWKLGYDVWIWNARGNQYSTEHVKYHYLDDRFFYFSMDELGTYDTTASIDYILNQTGHSSVITIGHSMGTTNVLIAASNRPEYMSKVRLNMLWGQSAFLGSMAIKGQADVAYSMVGVYFNPWNKQHSRISPRRRFLKRLICNPGTALGNACTYLLGLFSGFGSDQTVVSAAGRMSTKYPSGTSLSVAKQMIQNMRTGEFSPLSYGYDGNLKRYGVTYPAPYPIGKVTIPTAIYYACCNDFLSDAKDAKILASRLPNVVRLLEIPNKRFNHGDFLWAKDGYRLFIRDALFLIDQHTPQQYRAANLTIQ